jgi:hypothetical protein
MAVMAITLVFVSAAVFGQGMATSGSSNNPAQPVVVPDLTQSAAMLGISETTWEELIALGEQKLATQVRPLVEQSASELGVTFPKSLESYEASPKDAASLIALVKSTRDQLVKKTNKQQSKAWAIGVLVGDCLNEKATHSPDLSSYLSKLALLAKQVGISEDQVNALGLVRAQVIPDNEQAGDAVKALMGWLTAAVKTLSAS